MKAKILVTVLLLVVPPCLRAQEIHYKPAVAAATRADTAWNTNSYLWMDLVYGRPVSRPLQIGRSGLTLSGPLVETLPRGKGSPDRSLGEKIMAFPLVHWVVPQPMRVASSGGRYFAWGDSGRSWTSIAGGGATPTPGLISIGW